MSNATSYQTAAVLAGAYVTLKSCLTHLVEIDAHGSTVRVMCRGVKLDNIADGYALSEKERTARPTCKVCGKKWDTMRTAEIKTT